MLSGIFASIGLILLIYRMWPRVVPSYSNKGFIWPKVSIIVPARNEERVIGVLLQSLNDLTYLNYEVIVVDDESSDRTASIAAEHGARVIRGEPRPTGWNGKQWACHQGALAAQGEYLLFTDADTRHEPRSLQVAIQELLVSEADVLTALPSHRCQDWWEKLCGPFHVILLALTHPYGEPRPGRVFAIGQYLLFKRRFYESIGGHRRVKADWVEDVPLAEASLAAGGDWNVYTGSILFRVRMYENLAEFVRGWRRNVRAGMGYVRSTAFLEMMLFMAALLGGARWDRSYNLVIMALTALCMLRLQKTLGDFSPWGVVFLPFSLGLFCWISLLAAFDRILQRPLQWKDRAYSAKG